MQHRRQDVVDLLRRAGFSELAEKASRELPDPVDVEEAVRWAGKHGLSTDMLISQLGGSP
ncbi:MAG TPA: hypothetical protein VMG38_20980 [Trebonia sp.]|nr:hypothetical protein [Trebonia sp.]